MLDSKAIKVKQCINVICCSCLICLNCLLIAAVLLASSERTCHCSLSFILSLYSGEEMRSKWAEFKFLSKFPPFHLNVSSSSDSCNLFHYANSLDMGVLLSHVLSSACKTTCILLQLENPRCIIKSKKAQEVRRLFQIFPTPHCAKCLHTPHFKEESLPKAIKPNWRQTANRHASRSCMVCLHARTDSSIHPYLICMRVHCCVVYCGPFRQLLTWTLSRLYMTVVSLWEWKSWLSASSSCLSTLS